MPKYKYVLITPARNEERFIEQTIRALISQVLLPEKWIIVSDGSTDKTDEIVTKYLDKFPWMELVRTPEHHDRTKQLSYTIHMGYSARTGET